MAEKWSKILDFYLKNGRNFRPKTRKKVGEKWAKSGRRADFDEKFVKKWSKIGPKLAKIFGEIFEKSDKSPKKVGLWPLFAHF